MKAVVLDEVGGPEKLQLEAVPDPAPGPAEVVVRLRAAALNHRDVWIRRGRYAGIKLPAILGSDGAGEVQAVGTEALQPLVGRPVVIDPTLDWGSDPRVQASGFRILGMPDPGTYAQCVKVPASNVYPKPEALSMEEAAAIPLASLTAYRAVVTRARVQPDETVVVTGIGGGVSTFALLIARRLGARVFVTSGSDEKIARACELGAAGGVNYHAEDWAKQLVALVGAQGPDVVVDSVAGATFDAALEIVRPGGRIVTFGATTGPAPKIEVRRIFWKQLTILGTTMGNPDEFAQMLRLYEDGSMKPVIDRIFPLAEAAEAHRRMEEARQLGKIVLSIE